MIKNWWKFINEYFPLQPHFTMVFVFTGFNFLVGSQIISENGIYELEAPMYFGWALILCLSFLFRLELFDAIKEYECDKIYNPNKTLAKDLIKISTVFKAVIALSLIELALAASISKATFLAHLTAVAYSFLMYKEFFIGPILRPYLTIHRLIHNLGPVLLGFSLMSVMANEVWFHFHSNFLILGLVNWCFFNIFAFTKKTFAPREEKPKIASYSKHFGVWGALALSLFQVVAALFIIRYLGYFSYAEMTNQWIAVGLILLISFSFGFKPTKSTAKAFRNCWSLFIILFYALISYQILY